MQQIQNREAHSCSRDQIARWLLPEEIVLDLPVGDQDTALEEIADRIATRHRLDAASIQRALTRRERAGSTALGNGFAIPHARIPGLTRPLTMFVRTRSPIGFSAPDGKPVCDILTILVPEDGAKQDHLQLLALVAELFSNADFRRQLGAAIDVGSAAALFEAAILRIVTAGPSTSHAT